MAVHLPGVIARRVVLLLACALVASLSWAGTNPPAEVTAELQGARQQGSGKLTYFGLAVYEARLWAGEGFAADRYEQSPLAIEIEYARGLDGKAIAERSLTEMKRSGSISEAQGERWLTTMQQTFPDVVKGDRITGVYRQATMRARCASSPPSRAPQDW